MAINAGMLGLETILRGQFITPGAIRSFEKTLGQAASQYHWRVHAYDVMRNHYHLAIETPQPNLVDGMHWLQSTFSHRISHGLTPSDRPPY